MVDNNLRVYLVILRHEGPCFFLSSISYGNFQHSKLVLNAVGRTRSLPRTPACLCGGGGKWLTMGQVHPWQSSLEQAQGCLWSTGTLSFCHTSCPEEGNHLHGLAVGPQLLHLGNAGGREEAGAQRLFASRLTICRHCWKSCTLLYPLWHFFPSST